MDPSELRRLVRNFPENGIKLLLESTANVRELLGLSGHHAVGHIVFDRLRLDTDSFIQSDYRHVESDVVLQAPLINPDDTAEALWIYILIEHQSEPDPTMPLRLLRYIVAIFSHQERRWCEAHPKRSLVLQPVLPIVFYTGTARWASIGSMEQLVRGGSSFRAETPSFDPVFLNLSAIDATTLETEGGYLGWVLQLVQQRRSNAAAFRRLVARVVRHLETMPEADNARWLRLLSYIQALIYHVRAPTERPGLREQIEVSVSTDPRRKEVMRVGKTIAEDLIEQGRKEGLEKGMREGITEGRAEGRAEGRLGATRETLIRLLERRFGAVPDRTVATIRASTDQRQLEGWLDRFATATGLDDIGIS